MTSAAKLATVCLCMWPALAQQRTISARAGTINYQQGRVYADDQRVHSVYGSAHPIQLKNGQQLRIETGRVEVLLGLGVYLRMAGPSAIRMQETHLDDVQVVVESGSALIEVAGMYKGARLRVFCGEGAAELKHDGFYRFDAPFDSTPGRLRVFNGEASVERDAMTVRTRGGQAVDLAGVLAASKFDIQETDALQTWAKERSKRRTDAERRRMEARAMERAKRRAEMDGMGP